MNSSIDLTDLANDTIKNVKQSIKNNLESTCLKFYAYYMNEYLLYMLEQKMNVANGYQLKIALLQDNDISQSIKVYVLPTDNGYQIVEEMNYNIIDSLDEDLRVVIFKLRLRTLQKSMKYAA